MEWEELLGDWQVKTDEDGMEETNNSETGTEGDLYASRRSRLSIQSLTVFEVGNNDMALVRDTDHPVQPARPTRPRLLPTGTWRWLARVVGPV